MAIKIKLIDTNIFILSKFVGFVHFDQNEIYFKSDSFFKKKSISINSALSITPIDSDQNFTTFTVEFSGQQFLTLKCNTETFSKHIQKLKLQPAPFEIKERISNSAIFGTTLGVILIISALSDKNNSISNMKTLSESEKSNICKAYIGEIFGKPTSIIENYRNKDNLIYVRYTREVDNSEWSYVCDISNGTITWAGWMSDTQEWGRWRYEDQTKLNYEKGNNTITFEMNNTGSKVIVNL